MSQWRRLQPDRIRQVASVLVEAHRLLPLTPARDVASWLGWPVVEDMPASLALDPGLQLDGDDATVGIGPDGHATTITIALTSAVLESTGPALAFKSDVFAAAAEVLTRAYGSPSHRTPGTSPTLEWQVDGAPLLLRDDWVTVNLSTTGLAAGEPDDEPDGEPAMSALTGTDAPVVADVTVPSWEQLSDALSRALAALPPQAALILSDQRRPEYFVQYLQTGSEIQAYATGLPDDNDVPQLAVERRRILELAGWRPPRQLPFHWGFRLPWPARSTGYLDLAKRSVVALRNAYGVTSPADVAYTAWVNGSAEPLDVPALTGIARVGQDDLTERSVRG